MEPHAYLICYDITDQRRLARVHRFLSGEALALQYSVFVGVFSAGALRRVLEQLGRRIDPRRDDVRVYSLSGGGDGVFLGLHPAADGILLAHEGLALLQAGSKSVRAAAAAARSPKDCDGTRRARNRES